MSSCYHVVEHFPEPSVDRGMFLPRYNSDGPRYRTLFRRVEPSVQSSPALTNLDQYHAQPGSDIANMSSSYIIDQQVVQPALSERYQPQPVRGVIFLDVLNHPYSLIKLLPQYRLLFLKGLCYSTEMVGS